MLVGSKSSLVPAQFEIKQSRKTLVSELAFSVVLVPHIGKSVVAAVVV